MNAPVYNFAYLDEQTKRMIRRAILKAIAIPGYQVPFASREMPMPYGWGTGGVQVTAAILGPDDVLKVIDQGSDDATNAVSIRKFFAKTAGVRTTTRTTEATVVQTRHPSPTPKFDNPKMNNCAALQLFGAGREKRIYAIPPYTKVVSLDFEDHPFERYRHQGTCALCGSAESFLDEVVTDDRGGRMFLCSDTDYCEGRRHDADGGPRAAATELRRA
jgi:alpha-D-ribose 1-methylphosphonate 5-phosphate C-P lyase